MQSSVKGSENVKSKTSTANKQLIKSNRNQIESQPVLKDRF